MNDTEREEEIFRGRSRLSGGRGGVLMWDSVPRRWNIIRSQRQLLKPWATQASPYMTFFRMGRDALFRPFAIHIGTSATGIANLGGDWDHLQIHPAQL